ncbi:hypothetical protein OF83DRAFT_1108560, partial [Amylostereum chailletii]
MPSFTAEAIGSRSLPQGTSRKRSLPDDTPTSDSKKLKLEESTAQARDKKDKKRRKKKRKTPVVQAGSKSPSVPTSFAKETSGPPSVTSSPVPIVPPPPDLPDTLPTPTIKTPSPAPEFIQGSSFSQGTWSPLRATSTSTPPKTAMEAPSTHSPHEDEAHLKQTLATMSESLAAHRTIFSSLVSSITCQICLDLLHKPFALSPCGHMTCYDCLVSWFTTPPPGDVDHEPPIWRKKTCPHCRSVVSDRPVEVWAVKDMVVNVVKSGLATGFSPPHDLPNEPTANDEDATARDLWTDIFPPAPTVHGDGHPEANDQSAFGMLDVEDDVYRCIDCLHEIWEGSCAQCGRIYPGHDEEGSGSDSDYDIDNIYQALNNGLASGYIPQWHTTPILDEQNSTLYDSDEGSYQGSFIDDEGELDQHADAPEVFDLSSDGEDGSTRGSGGDQGDDDQPILLVDLTNDEDEDLPPPPRIRRVGRSSVVSSDEAFSDTSGPRASGSGHGRTARPRRARGVAVIQSDEEDEQAGSDDGSVQEYTDEEEDGSIARPPRHLAHLFRERSPSLHKRGKFHAQHDSDDSISHSDDGDQTPDEEVEEGMASAGDGDPEDEDEPN